MPLLLLVRHGENDYVKKKRLAGRLPGVHLNETGYQQAQTVAHTLASKLKKASIQSIFSSPLERTMETAEPIAEALDIPIVERPGLIETDFGDWQGKTLKDLARRKLWKVVQKNPSLMRFPGGESFAETQTRICSEIEILRSKHRENDVIICVSHSDPIKLAVAYYLGLPLDLFQRLTIAPASITTLLINESGSRLLNLNIDFSLTLMKH
jgi:probable phosphomutase (TIGR03848 family)